MAPEIPQPHQGVTHSSGEMCRKLRAPEQVPWGCGGAESLDRLGQLFPNPCWPASSSWPHLTF